MESALREGEANSLQAVSQTIAASLQGRTDLLYRAPPPPAEAADEPQPDSGAQQATAQAFDKPGPDDLEPLALTAAPLLDGYGDDWPHQPDAWTGFKKDEHHHFAALSGVYERMLYVLLEVHDEHPLYDAPGTNTLDAATFGDRVWLGFDDAQGEQHQVFISATGPGSVSARRVESGEYGQRSAPVEPRIRGAWQPSRDGYRIELRVPLSMIGHSFGILVDDRDARGAAPVSYGTLRSDDLHTLGRLIVASPELSPYLTQFLQPGLKLAVNSPAGRVLARADALARPLTLGRETPVLASLYRRFVDRPGERQVLESTAPIYDRDHAAVIGSLEVTQTADRWIRLRDHALTRMLNFTLATSLVAVVAMFAFAAWLALRLARLRSASESALTRSGLVTSFPETEARDELGDVARSFSTLLARLNEYTSYLRTLAGKLAHEIRTPLTIVRSSLDNLDSEPVGEEARAYLDPRPPGERAAERHPARHGRGDPGRGSHRRGGARHLRSGAIARLRGGRLPRRVPGARVPGRAAPRPGEPERRPGPHRAAARQAHRQRGGFQPGGRAYHGPAAPRAPGGAHRGRKPGPAPAPARRRPAVRVAVAVPARWGQPPPFRARTLHSAADRRIPRGRGRRPQPRGRERSAGQRPARPLRASVDK